MRYRRPAGLISPGRCRDSEAGANPALSRNCDAGGRDATSNGPPDEPGRLSCADERQPSEEGRFAASRRRANLLRHERRFFMVYRTLAGIAFLALALSLAGASSAAATGAFPVTVAAANGKVSLADRPVRIVSLSPTATEDLFAIGAGPQVVAVDDQSNFPKHAPRTKLSGYTPNVEAIAAYRPDLVVVSNDTNDLLKALGKLRIPELLEPAPANLTGAYAQIRALGVATGRTAAADRLVARLKGRVAAVVGSLPRPAAKLSVYHELGPDYYSVTSRTFIGQVYALLGLRNIADKADKAGSGYPKLSGEYILAANPSLVVLSDTLCCGQTAAKVKSRPGWSGLAAARDGGIVAVSDDVASRWGPRIVAFIQAVAAGIRSVAGR